MLRPPPALVTVAALGLAFSCAPPKPPSPAPTAAAPTCPPWTAPDARDAASARPRQVIQSTHTGEITALAFSPDGTLVATAGADHSVRIWQIATRKLITMARYSGGVLGQLGWLDDSTVGGVARDGDIATTIVRLSGTTERGPARSGTPVTGGGRARWLVNDDAGPAFVDDRGQVVSRVTLKADASDASATVTDDGRHVAVQAAMGEPKTIYTIGTDGALTPFAVAATDDGVGVVYSPDGRASLAPVFEASDAGPYAKLMEGFGGPAAPKGPARYVIRVAGDPTPHPIAVPPTNDEVRSTAISNDGKLAVFADSNGLVAWRVDQDRAAWRGAYSSGLPRLNADSTMLVTSTDGGFTTSDPQTGRERSDYGAPMIRSDNVAILDPSSIAVLSSVTAIGWSIDDGRFLHYSVLSESLSGSYKHRVGQSGRLVGFNGHVDEQGAQCRRPTPLIVSIETFDTPPRVDDVVPADPRSSVVVDMSHWPKTGGKIITMCSPPAVPYLRDYAGGVLLSNARGLQASFADGSPPVALWKSAEASQESHVGPTLSADGRYVADMLSSWDGSVHARVWLTHGPQLILEADMPAGAAAGDEWTAATSSFSPDGRAVAFRALDKVVAFDLAEPHARTELPVGVTVTALAYGADARQLMVGTADGTLVVYREGHEVGRAQSDGGALGAVRFEPTRHIAVTISEDGAARVWDADQGILRASLAAFQDEEWVIATPGGAYTGTGEVGTRVGWVWSDPPEHFGFEQFTAFRDEALVRARLRGETTADARTAVRRPPRVTIAPEGLDASGSAAKLRVRASSGSRVDVVRVYVEGRESATQAVCAASGEAVVSVPLLQGSNKVVAIASDAQGFVSNPAMAEVKSARADSRRPDVWVVAVGVSRYPHVLDHVVMPPERRAQQLEQMQLPAARNDALGIADAFRGLAGPLGTFREAHVHVLTDDQATPDAIRAALGELSAMDRDDLAVVFFAGHGFKPSDRDDMAFVTGDARLRPDGAGLAADSARDAIGWATLSDALAGARGRVFLLLDACHAGHVTQKLVVPNEALASRLVREGRAGAIVFAAAMGRQMSYEPGTERGFVLSQASREAVRFDEATPHGFFTGALLGAMASPDTDADADGAIEASELIDEVTRRVFVASGGQQTPWVAMRDLFGDFSVERTPASPAGQAGK
jgi:WD40 repeat protein